MTVESVLRNHGVDTFANGLVDSLAGSGLVMVKPPLVPVRFFPVPPDERP